MLTRGEIFAKAIEKGLKPIYPSVTIDTDEGNKDIAETIRELVWGGSGTFKTIKTLDAYSVLNLIGVPEDDDDERDKMVDDLHRAGVEFRVQGEAGELGLDVEDTCDVLAFWGEDNEYPGHADD